MQIENPKSSSESPSILLQFEYQGQIYKTWASQRIYEDSCGNRLTGTIIFSNPLQLPDRPLSVGIYIDGKGTPSFLTATKFAWHHDLISLWVEQAGQWQFIDSQPVANYAVNPDCSEFKLLAWYGGLDFSQIPFGKTAQFMYQRLAANETLEKIVISDHDLFGILYIEDRSPVPYLLLLDPVDELRMRYDEA